MCPLTQTKQLLVIISGIIVSSKCFFISPFSLSESGVYLLSLWKSVNYYSDNSFTISVTWVELEEVYNSCATLTVKCWSGLFVTKLLLLFTDPSLSCISGFCGDLLEMIIF